MKLNLKGIAASILFCLTLTPVLTAASRLSLSTNAIGTINIAPGTNGFATLQAANIGSGALSLTAAASAPWISATIGTLGTCTNAAGNCYSVNIALMTGTLSPGTYTEYITLTDPNASRFPAGHRRHRQHRGRRPVNHHRLRDALRLYRFRRSRFP